MRIWIDLDNSPHVPLFRPIVAELRRRGCEVLLTARDCAQTCELARLYGLEAERILGHPPKNKALKVLHLLHRTARLTAWAAGRRIDLAVSHGSRAMTVAAWLSRIPIVTLYDYENAFCQLFNRLSRKVMTPDLIPRENLAGKGLRDEKLVQFPGIKEQIYLGDFEPNRAEIEAAGIDLSRIVVVIRPPAAHAHYHSEEGERLLDSLLERVAGRPDLSVVILPRTKEQGEEIRRRAAELRLEAVIPNKPLHGLNLVVHADLVVSGGGTMNREAIALGAPVYSIFKGALGSLDRMFIASGKMQHIGSPEELGRIRFEKRASGAVDAEAGPRLIQFIVGELLATAAPAGAKHPAMRPAADPAGGEGSRRFDG